RLTLLRDSLKNVALQIYRLVVLVAIAWIIHVHYLKLRIGGLMPVTVDEVRSIFPTATDVSEDAGERAGWFVKDANGTELGYALRTSPYTDGIIGYRGWTDALVAFDPALHVVGVQ